MASSVRARSGKPAEAGGIGFTWIVGRVAKSVGYGPLFVGIAFFDVIGAIFLWSLLREPRARALEVAQ